MIILPIPQVEMIHSVLRELERIDGANGLSEAKKDMDAFAKSASLRVGNLAFFSKRSECCHEMQRVEIS